MKTHVALRPFVAKDKDQLLRWRNSDEVRKYMYGDHVITQAEHNAWFERVATDPSVRHWIVETGGVPVGAAHLHDIDAKNRRCYWGFYVGSPSVRGRGVGAYSQYCLLRYAFEELDLDKVCGEVLASNEHSLKMHQGFGFHIDGVLREHVARNGTREDVIAFSMLRREWPKQRQNIEARLMDKVVMEERHAGI